MTLTSSAHAWTRYWFLSDIYSAKPNAFSTIPDTLILIKIVHVLISATLATHKNHLTMSYDTTWWFSVFIQIFSYFSSK